ncbi:MAG TPA: phosphatase PAP2 family protein [Ramlibacter sp.]|uniref:phosphatase PAP2 family protein n=1 Tax=Ramlibacter sp. TaxID=1917967 RepID=UPI002D7EE60D|nr:phosphatase PAP2 family protein [Ramlibacter sp.]HET8748721.1 phosphatase PAP2 family protein [Ramlibacter sp.]
MRRGSAPSEAGWITLGLLMLALAWDASGLDLPLARLAGSAAGFALREHWLLAGVAHEGARRVAWLLALALCLGVWWPIGPLARLTQGERTQLALTTLLGALAVAILKAGSHTSCPWELGEFGGLAQYASHWSLRPDGGAGHCFPAGHAASGFTFVGGYFAFRRSDAQRARAWLVGALAAGLLLGLAQQWRGAHFMSHTLWSAAVCWATACVVDAAWPRRWRLERI